MANPLAGKGTVSAPNLLNSSMMNNPLLGMLTGSANPRDLLMQQMMQNNPVAQQAMQMMQNKNPQQLEQMVQQLANQKGVNLDQLKQQASQMMSQFNK